MKNLTNLHKKLDRITERLNTLDTRVMTDARRSDMHFRLMERSLQLLIQIHNELRTESREQSREIALLTAEALKASRESAERAAQILAHARTQ